VKGDIGKEDRSRRRASEWRNLRGIAEAIADTGSMPRTCA
jgi:hypothetical protein